LLKRPELQYNEHINMSGSYPRVPGGPDIGTTGWGMAVNRGKMHNDRRGRE